MGFSVRKLVLPNDFDLIRIISNMDPDIIFGGSLGEHLCMCPNCPGSFKDIDISAPGRFLDMIYQNSQQLREIMDEEKYVDSSFQEDGTWGPKRKSVTVNGKKYPARVIMVIRGVMIDVFTINEGIQPFQKVCVQDLELKVMDLRHRIKVMDSIIAANALREKNPSPKKRRQRIVEFLESQSTTF